MQKIVESRAEEHQTNAIDKLRLLVDVFMTDDNIAQSVPLFG